MAKHTVDEKRILSVLKKANRVRQKLTKALYATKTPDSEIHRLERTLERYDAQALALLDARNDVLDKMM